MLYSLRYVNKFLFLFEERFDEIVMGLHGPPGPQGVGRPGRMGSSGAQGHPGNLLQ